MKKIKEYYICDRCKRAFEKDVLVNICEDLYFYDLCKECKKFYDKYVAEIKEIDKMYDEITKKYRFGKYLFESELKDSDIK